MRLAKNIQLRISCWAVSFVLVAVGCKNEPGHLTVMNETARPVSIRCIRACTLGLAGASATPPVYHVVIGSSEVWSTSTASSEDTLQEHPSFPSGVAMVAVSEGGGLSASVAWEIYAFDSRDDITIVLISGPGGIELSSSDDKGGGVSITEGRVFWDE
ncbi:MAG: hypothetical protein IT431_15640 [Phycisphaerales bacterium]|nr:hypothetical protein [Phycisphaerales bacterium]